MSQVGFQDCDSIGSEASTGEHNDNIYSSIRRYSKFRVSTL